MIAKYMKELAETIQLLVSIIKSKSLIEDLVESE